jgi:hypothetical protein
MMSLNFRVITHCFGGVVLLAVLSYLGFYGGAVITVITLGIAGGSGSLIANLVPICAACVLFLIGSNNRELRGLAFAPFVAYGLWFSSSLAARIWLSVSTRDFIASDRIDPSALKHPTLVFRQYVSVPLSILANGVVERLVEVSFEGDQSDKIREIFETRLARGLDCQDKSRAMTSGLEGAGRNEECYLRTRLSSLPDGLHILESHRQKLKDDCCQEISAKIVVNGSATTERIWRRGYAKIPGYLPVFMSSWSTVEVPPTGIWQQPAGPLHYVAYGDPDLRLEAMIGEIYGFKYDTPVNPSSESKEVLSKRAWDLAQSWD